VKVLTPTRAERKQGYVRGLVTKQRSARENHLPPYDDLEGDYIICLDCGNRSAIMSVSPVCTYRWCIGAWC